MSFFYYDKETNGFWVFSNSIESVLTEIKYATVSYSDSYFKIHSFDSNVFSLENDKNFLIFNSQVIKSPCTFCKKNLSRMFSTENCKPCTFQIEKPYDQYELPFDKDSLENSLIQNGLFRTTKKLFLKSIFKSKQ